MNSDLMKYAGSLYNPERCKAAFLCPECGHKNEVFITSFSPEPIVTFCYIEDGGCDTRLVVDFDVTVKAYASKIGARHED